MENNLINECRKKAVELLIKNSSKNGIIASLLNKKSRKRNYNNIFGRDASICALGMVVSKNKKLIEAAKNGLLNLEKFQAENGQIPFFIDPKNQKSDFWYLGNIDSTLWWLIAIFYFDKYSGDKIKLKNKLSKNIQSALRWLISQEHPKFFLLIQNEASDWADIMPRSGFVLYSNALWYWVKKLYGFKNTEETKKNFNYIYYPWQKIPANYFAKNHRAKRLVNYIRQEKKKDCLLSFINFSFWGNDIDIYGNLLACLSGAADKRRAEKIIRYFLDKKISRPHSVKSCLNPIMERSKSWRRYMESHQLNFPYQYHNGGCWPYIGGFWVMALKNIKEESKLAENELVKLAQTNKINNWQFNEWFHGKTGKPMGMAGQSWNAANFILAYHYLGGDFKL